MAEDRKWKNIRKKSTEHSTGEKPPVDNSHEEEIPEWKSSIRKEPLTEKAEPEHQIMKHKKTIAAAAAIIVVGAVAFGVTPMLINQGTGAKKQTEKAEKDSADTKTENPSEKESEETASPENMTEPKDTSEDTTSSKQDAGEESTESTASEKKEIPPVAGLAHIESYESLYNILHKWQSENSDWSASDGARILSTDGDLVEYDAEAVSDSTTGSVAANEASKDTGNMDPGYTYDEMDAADHSSTNTQEENVDEADIVKTDGTYIYAMDSKGDIRIVDAASMKLVSEITGDRNADYMEMYLNGDSLQVIHQQETYITYRGTVKLSSDDAVRASYSVPVTTVSVDTYDLSDRENPKKTGSCQQDGSYLSSRRNGNNLYLFTSYAPDTTEGADAKVKYIPRIGDDYIAYDHIYLPVPEDTTDYTYNGKNYLVVSSVADEKPDQVSDSMAVISGADTFYVSENNIYSAVPGWNISDDSSLQTEIIRIGYEDGVFTEGGTGSVSGELNNNFSMDEYDGHLRVVTTTAGWNKDYSEYHRTNGLYVLDKDMKTVGKIENLAENEEIKSARFMGKTGYFVTYENTDPLFSADLSDPESPKILGELKITGFSEYLHFYGENRLLGIGWETDPDTGSTEGLKCSMFDISDPSDVKEIDRIVLKNVSVCDALSNYRAILVSPGRNLFGFAYGMYKNSAAGDYYDTDKQYYYGLLSYSEEEGFEPDAYLNPALSGLFDDTLSTSEYRSLRGVYISDTFYLVTENGISSYDMTDGYKLQNMLAWK